MVKKFEVLLICLPMTLALSCGENGGNGDPQPVCGDGIVEGIEECDEGEGNADGVADACRSDCTLPRCGDGVADGDESCDGTDLSGDTCLSLGQGLRSGELSCDASCEFDVSSCAECGNGNLEAGEQCDGEELDGESCEGLGFYGGQLGCDGSCTFDQTDCMAGGLCGDGEIQSGHEVCDGSNLDGMDCTGLGLGYTDGALVCSTACELDDSGCTTCGDGVTETPYESCDDANADDWDGCTGCVVSEFQVNSWWVGIQYRPAVAVSATGRFVVVWEGPGQTFDSTYDVLAQVYDAQGSPVSVEFRVNEYDQGSQHKPRVAMDDSGSFVVVWRSNSTTGGTHDGIYGRRYGLSGQPAGGEFRIDDASYPLLDVPDVAMNANGDMLVAWNCYAFGDDICAQRYSPLGQAVGGNITVNSVTTGEQNNPAVALAADGRGLVVWMGEGVDGFEIFARRITTGGLAQGGEITVNSTTTESQRYPDVAMAANGSFIVVFESDPVGSSYEPETHGRLFTDTGVAVGAEFNVPSSPTTNVDFYTPQVCADSQGAFTVIWNHSSSVWGQIEGRRFDSLGQPLGPDFQVALSQSSQRIPACAMTDDGRLIVGYVHSGLDGDSNGIFAQRYDANGAPIGMLPW